MRPTRPAASGPRGSPPCARSSARRRSPKSPAARPKSPAAACTSSEGIGPVPEAGAGRWGPALAVSGDQQVLLTLIAGMVAPLALVIFMIHPPMGNQRYRSTTPYFHLIERRSGKSDERDWDGLARS